MNESGPLVSVVIPALNEESNILAAITAARRSYTEQQVEILVVDGGSTDRTVEVAQACAAVILSSRGRAVQMNQGAAASKGEILVFCHADSLLPDQWREAVIHALSDPGVSGGAFQTIIHPPKGILHLVNRFNFPADWRIIFGDLCQFMRRETFHSVGGYPEIPLMEDVEMGRLLYSAGRIVRTPLRVQTSSRRFIENGPLRQWLLSLSLMIRYLYFNHTPEQVAARYRSTREEIL
jgi:rSAM/selenodomain-associated transferase 2